MLTMNSKKEDVLKLTHPCRCPKCENSCNYGSGALVGDDLKNLAEFLGLSEEDAKEKYLEEVTKFNTTLLRPKLLREDKPYGKCIFYDNGCTVHKVKPFECKLAMSCKPYGPELITWFNLNHFLNKDDLESLRQFKLYMDAGGDILKGAEEILTDDLLTKIAQYEDLKDDRDWDEVLGLK